MDSRAWVATRKGLFELRRRGGGWVIGKVSFLGEPVSMVLPPTASGRMLAALNLGHFGVKVHASDDGGATWREVTAPAYPPQPEGAPGPAWKLVQIWALEAAGDEILAGTLPGGLFRSKDGAQSWQLDLGLWNQPKRPEWFGGGYPEPGIHSICPHPDGELLIGVSCAGAWSTRDGGQTWRQTAHGMRADFMPPEQAGDPDSQDPHAIQRCAARPDVLWCQHHCGIWRSTDRGASWQPVTGVPVSAFGFAVAAHPHDPQTAWFVPAVKDETRVPVDGALVVNRTRDGGASFETLREGLPQQDCYDLVYRHGLAVGRDGRSLLMGSTTGGLWSSEDGGDRWATVSVHLPPIYAVKIG
jgi:photosystem II stability/assembly factor-like uncharacterized protein